MCMMVRHLTLLCSAAWLWADARWWFATATCALIRLQTQLAESMATESAWAQKSAVFFSAINKRRLQDVLALNAAAIVRFRGACCSEKSEDKQRRVRTHSAYRVTQIGACIEWSYASYLLYHTDTRNQWWKIMKVKSLTTCNMETRACKGLAWTCQPVFTLSRWPPASRYLRIRSASPQLPALSEVKPGFLWDWHNRCWYI